MKLTIDIDDINDSECCATLRNEHDCVLAKSAPQLCVPDALRQIGELFTKMAVDVCYAAEHGSTMDRNHPKVREIMGWQPRKRR